MLWVSLCCHPWTLNALLGVPMAADVLDLQFWDRLLAIAALGGLFFVHFGTPCNTFSAARKDDGGPPPLRSLEFPLGLPTLSSDNTLLVMMGNLFVSRTEELAWLVVLHGGDVSIENPLLSLMWATPALLHLQHEARMIDIDFDQCVFGAPSKKPTRIRATTNVLLMDVPSLQCQGGHAHEVLQGHVWDPVRQRLVYRTKLAQEYPEHLCAVLAQGIHLRWSDSCAHFLDSFRLTQPSSERKRPLGQPSKWCGHRQEDTAAKALRAGYQLKRGAAKPLLDIEMEPGQAIEWALQVVHPFSTPAPLEETVLEAVQWVARQPAVLLSFRAQALQFWEAEAHRLLPVSLARIAAQPVPHLRRLLLGCADSDVPKLGQVCHVALYEAMLKACDSPDVGLISHLLEGFAIVGPIAPSNRWPQYDKDQQALPVQCALDRAWELQSKMINRVQRVPCSENLDKIWEATLEDCSEGSCVGPWYSAKEVSEFLGCSDWIPTQRFEVVQKNKVRGCDSATTNLVNPITVITEKLQLPSTDTNVAVLRSLRSMAPLEKLTGWVLDERKAYRQIAVKPDQRKFSVICLKDPKCDRPAFFVMIGHSFGLVSAVYNYNRRSAAINEILVKLFKLVAFSFHDDKYGFETNETASSARLTAECVHTWLGARFDQKKLQLSEAPTILGVTYNLTEMQLEIKSDRKSDLISEINSILESGLLDPGHAGELKGKLMFGASQLWGKVGRAFLRVISERQYMKFPLSSQFVLEEPLVEALKHWRHLVEAGPPRTIDFQTNKKSDVVIFTDGFTPDPREADERPDRVGGVLFDRRLKCPLQFSSVVPRSVKEKWLERTTQIIPIEMLAPLLALSTFSDRLVGADVILLIDSEVVEAALIKGYSSRSDVCFLISQFWDLSLKLKCRIFIDRVSTDANPADWPSRDDLKKGEAAGWKTVQVIWPNETFQ